MVGVLAALAIAVAILAVAWSLDRDEAARDRPQIDPAAVTELVAPDPLSDEERSSLGGAAGGENALSSPTGVALAEGGWIEVADDAGRLKQRYAAARMDPLPDGWVEMREPRALIFGSRGQVTALEGGFGTARLPDREIESGTLREDVRIRFFRSEGDRPVSVEADEPWLVIEAENADFDGAEGRIRCDGPVSITSPELEFSGVNLLVLLQPGGREIERLVVDRATAPLRLRPQSRRSADSGRGGAGGASDSDSPATAEAGSATGAGSDAGTEATPKSPPTTPKPGAAGMPEPPTFMRLVLDGGVDLVRTQGGRRLSIEGDRLAAVFAMEGEGFGAIAKASPATSSPASPTSPASPPLRPLPRVSVTTWLAASAIAAAPDQRSGSSADSLGRSPAEPSTDPLERPLEEELVEIEFGGSLLIEPIEPGVPVPASAEEVWVRVEGREVLVVEEDREARIRCDLLDLRTGGPEGDRVDLLAASGVVEIEAPGLEMRAPAVRLRGSRVLVAGPGALRIAPSSKRDPAAVGAIEEEANRSAADPVEIEWADRLDLTLGPEQERLRRADFQGGESGRVRVRSDALSLDAGSLDVTFLENAVAGGDRIERIDAEGDVRADRPDAAARLEASRLIVEMRQDPDAARPGRVEASGGVRAFDAERVLWASSLDVVLRPREVRGANETANERLDERAGSTDRPDEVPGGPADATGPSTPREEFESVEARGGVVAGLADGTWIAAEGFEARPAEGRLRLDGDDVALWRDEALLDGLRGLSLVEQAGRVEARTEGAGRLQAARTTLASPWVAPSPEQSATWTWPPPPDRPAMPEDLAVAAVWEGGLRYLESRADAVAGVEVATLEVSDRVRARTLDENGTEDRLGGEQLRVGFRPVTGQPSPTAGEQKTTPELDPGRGETGLEIASMDLDGGASLERRRRSPDAAADRPDLLRIAGERIAYVVATGEGRVPGAGSLLVSEAPTGTRQGRTARFRWTERLDMVRRDEIETAVAISGEVELAFAGGIAGPAFTLTADRMDALLRAASPGEGDAAVAGELDRLELRTVAGAGRVFVRGRGRDVECDAFDYDADTGVLVLTARPGRSVSVMSTTAAAPVRADRVRWNLRTDRVEIESARGEG